MVDATDDLWYSAIVVQWSFREILIRETNEDQNCSSGAVRVREDSELVEDVGHMRLGRDIGEDGIQ